MARVVVGDDFGQLRVAVLHAVALVDDDVVPLHLWKRKRERVRAQRWGEGCGRCFLGLGPSRSARYEKQSGPSAADNARNVLCTDDTRRRAHASAGEGAQKQNLPQTGRCVSGRNHKTKTNEHAPSAAPTCP